MKSHSILARAKTLATLSIACVAVLAFGGQPAVASQSLEAEPTYIEVPMTTVALTKESALAYGFEVRKGPGGHEYALSPGAAAGDWDRAVKIPEIQMFDTRTGNCGKSWLYFDSRTKFRTGYEIFRYMGSPISHKWNVALTSRIDAGSYNLDGLAPWYSLKWEATRNHDIIALSGGTISAVAGGETLLSTGLICVALSPTASVRW